jgi:hypothetical protein
VCSNRYQNTRALADAKLPKCIMAVVAPLGNFSVSRNGESEKRRVHKVMSYVRQKCLATLAFVATIGPATRASFNNQDIALLRQVAGDADSDVAHDCRLSQAQAKKLPSISALDTGTCSVCIEEWAVKDELAQIITIYFLATKLSQLSCGHVFHPTCIQSWVVQSSSCPECRSNVAPA